MAALDGEVGVIERRLEARHRDSPASLRDTAKSLGYDLTPNHHAA